MIVISRKKVIVTRVMMWGGVAVMAPGIILSFLEPSAGIISIILIGVGLCISLPGAISLNRLFRCPNCKKSILPDNSNVDFRSGKCPDCCPYCGMKVQMKE